jgi:acetyl-CoA carboxylase biotin carboxylase subunit
LPVIPGSPALDTVEDAKKWACEIGYPIIIKAKAGGGGKGMKVAFNEEEIETAYTMARAEAKASFTSDDVYMEKYLQKPRHIEIQVLADTYGNVVHLGERDCSNQRKNQKVIEETPSPALNQQQRAEIGEIARSAVEKIGYSSAGTLEFLYEDGKFYFLEMNTRIQVEHPITEAVTGIDIVRDQIRVSSGAVLEYKQEDIHFNGYAMECRINAENPETFIPNAGRICQWHTPGGLDVRVDSEMYSGCMVSPYYDSLIAKLVVHGRTRNGVLMRLKRSLEEFVIDGVSTTIPLHQKIISNPEFIDAQYNIHWLENYLRKNKT